MSAEEDTFLKENVFGPVAKRVLERADALRHFVRFPRAGVEGWLKVEAIWALSERRPDLVKKLQGKGPDLQLSDDLFVELKGATDCNPVYIHGGLEKYQADCRYQRLACLFIGSGKNISACIDYLNAHCRVITYKRFSVGTDDWIVGLIVPQHCSAETKEEKKPYRESLAAHLTSLLEAGGNIEEIVEKINVIAERLHRKPLTPSMIRAHAKWCSRKGPYSVRTDDSGSIQLVRA